MMEYYMRQRKSSKSIQNEKVYSLLRYGVNVSPDVGAKKITVNLIDWEHPDLFSILLYC